MTGMIAEHENKPPRRGFIYLAYGERFIREAAVSARTVRQWHSEPITLITDQPVPHDCALAFDTVKIEPLKHCYSDKIRIGECDLDEGIFLDTDTHVLRPLDEVFALLQRFDVAVQFTEGGNHYRIHGVPAVFREPSAGIIAWRRNAATDHFFAEWRHWYDRIESEQGMKGAWDQRSLRAALWGSGVHCVSLPVEYQFYTYRPNVAAGEVVMVHGRGLASRDIAGIAGSTEFRIWIPKVGSCPMFAYATVRQMLGFQLRLSCRIAVVIGRRLLAWSRLWPLPESKRPA